MYYQNSEDVRQGKFASFHKDFSVKKQLLSEKHVDLIASSNIFTLQEKLRLLELVSSSSFRVATDIGVSLSERCSVETGKYTILDETILKHLTNELSNLPFYFTRINASRVDNETGKLNYLSLFMISPNEFCIEYIKNFHQSFGAYEHGIINGYPTSTIQAYLTFLERLDNRILDAETTIATNFIGPGYYSKNFWDIEKLHYDKILQDVTNIAPMNLINEASQKLSEFKDRQAKIWNSIDTNS